MYLLRQIDGGAPVPAALLLPMSDIHVCGRFYLEYCIWLEGDGATKVLMARNIVEITEAWLPYPPARARIVQGHNYRWPIG